jgi:hypothetical protein
MLISVSSLVSEIQVADHVDVEALRSRLRKMTEVEPLRFGNDNHYVCSPYANLGKPPLEAFVIQLREARAEWRQNFLQVSLRYSSGIDRPRLLCRTKHRKGRLNDPLRLQRPDQAVLRSLYGLTPAECRVALRRSCTAADRE